jgi:hypothetical protein
MAIYRKSALALAALLCLGVAVPAFAQGGADKATTDIKAAQGTLNEMQQLGAAIKARQAGGGSETRVSRSTSPTVSRNASAEATPKAAGKKAGSKRTAAPRKKKNP